MGKKSKRQPVQAAVPGAAINSKGVCRIVDEIWTKTQAPVPQSAAGLWQEYDALMGLVKTLREKQGPSPSPLPSRKERIAVFEKWLDEHGVDHSKVEIAEIPGMGYGLRAMEDLEMGGKVLVVPEKLMMTSETACSGQLGALVSRDRMLHTMPNVTLAVHLLNERYSSNTFWRPYIDVLPHSYSTPLYLAKHELQMLQVSPCLSEALHQIRSITRLYAHLHKVIRAHGDSTLPLYSMGFHYSDFTWAVSSVMSRQNEIPLQDGKRTALSLIPLWDMCNHTNSLMGTDFNVDGRTLECYASHSTSAGDEFKIFYGPRTNAELFIHQGFVYPHNEHDSLRIKLGLSSAEEAGTKSMKTQLLQRLGLPVSGVFHLLAVECCFSPQLRAFVRVFTASPAELQQFLSLEDIKLREILTTLQWRQDDTKALDFLEKRCKLLLQPYKTSVEEDERLLAKGELSECGRQAVLLRVCEKRILQYASEYAQKINAMVAQAVQAMTKRALENGESHHGSGQEGQAEGEEPGMWVTGGIQMLDPSKMTPEDCADSGQEITIDRGEGEEPGVWVTQPLQVLDPFKMTQENHAGPEQEVSPEVEEKAEESSHHSTDKEPSPEET